MYSNKRSIKLANKSIAIIVDDFSDRILEYDNVTLYDYGDLKLVSIAIKINGFK